jgi:translation initiation factor 3 subunit D
MAEVEKRHFVLLPQIDDNEDGWGPSTIPDKFKDIPYYSPYNKGDKLGKAADWQQQNYQGKSRFTKGGDTSREGVNTIFNWYYTDDDNTFQLVDNTKTQTKRNFGARRFQNRGFQNLRQHRGNQNWGQNPRQQKQQPRKHQQLNRYNQYGNQTYSKWGPQGGQPQRKKEHSVEIKADWNLVEEIEFSKLNKLNVDKEPEPKDLKACGFLEEYDKAYDRVSSRSEKALERSTRTFFNVTTSEDPVLKELSSEGEVFATDSILAHLMTCTRSVQPWDLVVTRVGSQLFLDKRDGSQFDILTVNETALEPPQDDGSLNREATFINQMFSQQVLIKKEPKVVFPNPHPFQTDPKEAVAAVAYKYRKWTIAEGLNLVARCEIDGCTDKDSFLTIKTLNEFDLKTGDWRKTIDSQKGALLATELKNNSMKLAKWTSQALLAGTHSFKLGYVSRLSPKDNYNHVILGTQDYKPREFATQIALNWKNCWAVLKFFIDLLMKQPEGKYALLRDTEKNAVLLYSVPSDMQVFTPLQLPGAQKQHQQQSKEETKE